jgi:hypothetical protein
MSNVLPFEVNVIHFMIDFINIKSESSEFVVVFVEFYHLARLIFMWQ